MPTITVSSNYAISVSDDVILADSTGGPITLTLPTMLVVGKRYYIKDKFGTTDINPIVISASPNTLDGQTSFTLTVDKQSITPHCDGTNWYIL